MASRPAASKQTGDEEGASAAAASLVAAFARHDTAAYFHHFAPDATFIFHTVENVLESRAEYEHLWSRWELEEGFRVLSCASSESRMRMIGVTAVFTHAVATTVETRAGAKVLAERETIVFERRGRQWVAVHEHLSPDPSQGSAPGTSKHGSSVA